MRYFEETITGEEISDPDFEHGEAPTINNYITFEYEVTVPEEGHYDVVEEYPETGGQDIEWVVDVPEEGEWHVYDHRDNVKRDITDVYEGDIPDYFDTKTIYEGEETVGIYHTFTEEEQAAYDAQQQLYEEESERWDWILGLYADKSVIDGIIDDVQDPDSIGGDLGDFAIQIAQSISDLWDAIEDIQTNLTPSYAVAKMKAILVRKGLLELEDIKEPMRELVRRILEEENK